MERHKIIPAIYLVLEKENKILLARRFNTGFKDGQYSLVAGHIEQGEAATKTLVREANEEIGIKVSKKDIKLVYVLHRKSDYKSQERVDFFFKATKWKGKIKNNEPEKCDDLRWFDKNKLPSKMIKYLRKVLKDITHRKIYGEQGW